MIVRPTDIGRARSLVRGRAPSRRITLALLGSVTAAFFLQMAAGTESPFVAARMGANVATLVWQGQWDRLVTASWLHAAWWHFAGNALGLYFLGLAMERLLGPSRLLVIYLASCILGAAASAAVHTGLYSLGASTGVVGLFAGLGFVLFAFREALPGPLRRGWRSWLSVMALQVVLWVGIGFAGVPIDHAGHAGGAAAGVGSTLLLTRGPKPLGSWAPRDLWANRLAVALAALTIVGLAISAGRYVHGRHASDAVLARSLLDDPTTDPITLNDLAFLALTDPEAGPEMIDLAARMAARAVRELDPNTRGAPSAAPKGGHTLRVVLDTLATAHYRQGRLQEAVELQREIFDAEPDAVFGSQLARFLHARLTSKGLQVEPGGASPLKLGLTTGGKDTVALSASAIGPTEDGVAVYALVLRQEELAGLVVARLAPGHSPPKSTRLPSNLARDWSDARLVPAWVDRQPEPAPKTPWSTSAIEMDDEVVAYP